MADIAASICDVRFTLNRGAADCGEYREAAGAFAQGLLASRSPNRVNGLARAEPAHAAVGAHA
jgi:hypothetical protein